MGLPYDMGNAGDLVKHGLLAEFTQWWCNHEARPIRFLDPFAGMPWVAPPKLEVTRRLKALPPCAVLAAQPDPTTRYYGSAYVVLNAARAVGCDAEVAVSDSDPEARRPFQTSQFRTIASARFSPSDGFSILEADVEGDLVLLDPFADFLPRHAVEVIPRLGKASALLACVLFVLNLDPTNPVGQRYRTLCSTYLRGARKLTCPTLPNRGVAGESRYEVEVLLVWRRLAEHPGSRELKDRLEAYARELSKVLYTKITLSRIERDGTQGGLCPQPK